MKTVSSGDSACHNCGTDAQGNFCHDCGQATTLHMPSAREFLHEFIAHYVALEGKLWRTLAMLLFRPGALSNEYIAGRRVRYVEPLRIYLTFSILFFAILKFGGSELVHLGNNGQPGADIADTRHIPTAEQVQLQVLGKPTALPQQWLRFEKLPADEQSKLLKESFFHYAPYTMFCLMPLFALYLKILYLGSGRRYGEHFLFALHSNAFAFIMMALMTLVPGEFLRTVFGAWLLAYLPWAMWRVYRGSKPATILRWGVLMAAYGLTLSMAILASVAAGVMLHH